MCNQVTKTSAHGDGEREDRSIMLIFLEIILSSNSSIMPIIRSHSDIAQRMLVDLHDSSYTSSSWQS